MLPDGNGGTSDSDSDADNNLDQDSSEHEHSTAPAAGAAGAAIASFYADLAGLPPAPSPVGVALPHQPQPQPQPQQQQRLSPRKQQTRVQRTRAKERAESASESTLAESASASSEGDVEDLAEEAASAATDDAVSGSVGWTGAPFFYCDVCQERVVSSPAQVTAHQASALHQYNVQSQAGPRPPQYFIPVSNVGHRMLRDKLGWEGFGLGRDSRGPTEPVRTRVKNDRLGIGVPQRSSLAVTHTTAERGKHGRSTYRADFDPEEKPKKLKLRRAGGVREREVARERQRMSRIRHAIYRDLTPFDELLS